MFLEVNKPPITLQDSLEFSVVALS